MNATSRAGLAHHLTGLSPYRPGLSAAENGRARLVPMRDHRHDLAAMAGAIDNVREPFNTNIVGQAAALAALDDEAHVTRAVVLNREGRGRLTEGLRELGLEVLPSQGNFVFVNVVEPARSIFERLLARGVVVRPAGPPYETWLRISVGLGEDNAACLDALRAALEEGGR